MKNLLMLSLKVALMITKDFGLISLLTNSLEITEKSCPLTPFIILVMICLYLIFMSCSKTTRNYLKNMNFILMKLIFTKD